MNREIIVLCAQSEISKLKTLFVLAGAWAVYPRDLNEAFELLERTEPSAFFISQKSEPSAQICLRELKRHTPSLPICVLLDKRDDETERLYLRMGAFSCIKPPWTPEEAAEVFKLSRQPMLKNFVFREKNKSKLPIIFLVVFLFILFSFISYKYGTVVSAKQLTKKEDFFSIKLPGSNCSGIFFSDDKVNIYDWLLQTVFSYSLKNKLPQQAVKINDEIYTYASDFITQVAFLSDDGYLHRRAKDNHFTILDKSGPFRDFSQFCFDGVYVWTFNEKDSSLSKRMNNSSLEKLKDFKLSKSPVLFTCDRKNLYYLYHGSYEVASLSDPEKILYLAKYKAFGKPFAFSSQENYLWLVHGEKGEYFLSRLDIIKSTQ